MALLARAYLQLYQDSPEAVSSQKATYCLDWLLEHRSAGYDEARAGAIRSTGKGGVVTPAGTPAISRDQRRRGDAFWTAWKTLGGETLSRRYARGSAVSA
jgi:hypothetical protein